MVVFSSVNGRIVMIKIVFDAGGIPTSNQLIGMRKQGLPQRETLGCKF